MKIVLCIFVCILLSGCASNDFKQKFIIDFQNEYQQYSRATPQEKQSIKSGEIYNSAPEPKSVGLASGSAAMQVNLKGVAIDDFIELIFGQVLKYPYVVDQNVKVQNKNIDVVIKRKINKQDLYRIGVNALERAGFFVNDDHGVLYIFSTDPALNRVQTAVVHMVLQNVSAAALDAPLQQHLQMAQGKGGADNSVASVVHVSGDGRRNIVISGEMGAVRQLSKIVAAFDQIQSRVALDIQIYELTLTGAFRYGLESFLQAAFDTTDIHLTSKTQIQDGVFNLALNFGPQLKLAFDLLKKNDKIHLLANPFIVCSDGRQSTFNVGNQIPTLASQKSTPELTSTVQSINYVNTGITVTFTPVVLSSKELMLNLSVEMSHGDLNTTSSINTPIIISRKLQSELRLTAGQSFVVAGLIQKQYQNTNHQLPFLGQWSSIFGSASQDSIESELIIIITPKILKDEISDNIDLGLFKQFRLIN